MLANVRHVAGQNCCALAQPVMDTARVAEHSKLLTPNAAANCAAMAAAQGNQALISPTRY
jgi:hypothetical protein